MVEWIDKILMNLKPDNVPKPLIQLLPMAEKWGIEDDFDREEALAGACQNDLEELVHSIDNVTDEDLYDWLAGDLAEDANPSAEYVALTCLTMAIDSAKLKLARLKSEA